MKINIRHYSSDDISAILEIINHYIITSTALYDYNSRNIENQELIFKDKLQKGFPIIVATENDTIVGFGYYGEFRFREAYKYTVEHSIYTHPTHLGKSIGKLILDELILIAKENTIHTMIGVIDSENQLSIKFHLKEGFEIVGKIKESGFKFNRWLHSVFVQKMI